MPRTKEKDGLAWETPPSEERPDWEQVAQTLRANPMRWRKVFEHGRASWATAVAIGHVAAVRPGLGFEWTTSDNTRESPRTCTLYMRFNPDLVDEVAEVVESTKPKRKRKGKS